MESTVRTFTNLRVLHVSSLSQLEDEVEIAIGNHLTKLEVCHSRDVTGGPMLALI
jgi:hypothetical protein